MAEYLATRRALGFKLEHTERFLRQFVAHLDQAGFVTISVDVTVAWACTPADADPYWWASRLAAVRGFARWWSVFDPATEIPGPEILPLSQLSRRADPYPYSDDDIAALMAAARNIPSPLRAATYETLVGLLAVTGMRVGEVINLDRSDLDTAQQTLTIRGTKFGKTRLIPVSSSTLEALTAYGEERALHAPHLHTPALFVTAQGKRLFYQNVHHAWLGLCQRAGLEAISARCRPRPHDLRHRFAINTLIGWHRDGENVHARLPALSTYLGHLNPRDTYWYLRAAPELMALAADFLEKGEQQ
ncbi:tyrosine-type recombinase/integrase [Leucobacter sp. HY1910]